jgi:beta-glucosidase
MGTGDESAGPFPFQDPDLPHERRIEDLIGRLTLEEKVRQLMTAAPAVERLGLPAYWWGTECIHGLGRAGVATVFPQAIGLAATFDRVLVRRAAEAISDEVRAKHHALKRAGWRGRRVGLTIWAPNVNIFRDPRWGRGQETYGEDPYLASRMGVAFIRGLQGDDPRYLKTAAFPKHFAVHSGPEAERHRFDAVVSAKDLHETYLAAFEACVREGGAVGVMAAYNRVNGEPCSASPTLLQRIFRETWGGGCVVSDGGALHDLHTGHGVTADAAESAALALRTGCDLNLGPTYRALPEAISRGLVAEEDLDRALRRLFAIRMRVGWFDPDERVPYSAIPASVVDCARHRELALEAARESIVLLRNDGGLLPLPRDLSSVAVVGPNAAAMDVLLGNYFGVSGRMVTFLEGIVGRLAHGTRVVFERGCEVYGDFTAGIERAAAGAGKTDAIIAVMGLSPAIEGEERSPYASRHLGDRTGLGLPGVQGELLRALCATGKPVVLVLTGGGPVAADCAPEAVPAILHVWYPGEEGGSALADVLFGDRSPSGRMPVTCPRSADDLPPFEDYSMEGRTYRYAAAEPLFPFGYGLSYTRFEYADLELGRVSEPGRPLELAVTVRNSGARQAGEVVQAYLSDLETSAPAPRRRLVGFDRVELGPGEARRIRFTVAPEEMALVRADGRRVVEPGGFRVTVGGHQGDARSERLTGTRALGAEFELRGEAQEL